MINTKTIISLCFTRKGMFDEKEKPTNLFICLSNSVQ